VLPAIFAIARKQADVILAVRVRDANTAFNIILAIQSGHRSTSLTFPPTSAICAKVQSCSPLLSSAIPGDSPLTATCCGTAGRAGRKPLFPLHFTWATIRYYDRNQCPRLQKSGLRRTSDA